MICPITDKNLQRIDNKGVTASYVHAPIAARFEHALQVELVWWKEELANASGDRTELALRKVRFLEGVLS